jgi:hypothetical protein
MFLVSKAVASRSSEKRQVIANPHSLFIDRFIFQFIGIALLVLWVPPSSPFLLFLLFLLSLSLSLSLSLYVRARQSQRAREPPTSRGRNLLRWSHWPRGYSRLTRPTGLLPPRRSDASPGPRRSTGALYPAPWAPSCTCYPYPALPPRPHNVKRKRQPLLC